MHKLKGLLLSVAACMAIMFGFLPMIAMADCSAPATTQEAAQCGACQGSGISDAQCANAANVSTSDLNKTIANIINIFSIVAGIIAVIMIIIAGFRYITGSGNDQTIASAKRTLIYAVVGLVIVALSQMVVKFVLHKTTLP